jgi:hypothetical protein
MKKEKSKSKSTPTQTRGVCPRCQKKGRTVVERVIPELDIDDMSDGQAADYMAAQMGGPDEDWTETETYYVCPTHGAFGPVYIDIP